MPDSFQFLSLDAFRRLDSNAKQAYLQQMKRYLEALQVTAQQEIEKSRHPNLPPAIAPRTKA